MLKEGCTHHERGTHQVRGVFGMWPQETMPVTSTFANCDPWATHMQTKKRGTTLQPLNIETHGEPMKTWVLKSHEITCRTSTKKKKTIG